MVPYVARPRLPPRLSLTTSLGPWHLAAGSAGCSARMLALRENIVPISTSLTHNRRDRWCRLIAARVIEQLVVREPLTMRGSSTTLPWR